MNNIRTKKILLLLLSSKSYYIYNEIVHLKISNFQVFLIDEKNRLKPFAGSIISF